MSSVPEQLKASPSPTLVAKPNGKGMHQVSATDAGAATDAEARDISSMSLNVLSGDAIDEEDGVPIFLWKVLVVGDIGAGKTALVRRWVHNVFSERYKSTIGVDFALKQLNFGNVRIRLQLWDVAGQERFGNMTRVYYKGALAAVVVCDNRKSSYAGVKRWVDDIREKSVKLPDGERDLPLMMLVNKCDLEREYAEKSWEEILEYAEGLGFFGVAEVSAKENRNLPGALIDLCAHLCRIKAYQKPPEQMTDRDVVRLGKVGKLKMPSGDGDDEAEIGDESSLSTLHVLGDPYNTQSAERFNQPGSGGGGRRRGKCCNT